MSTFGGPNEAWRYYKKRTVASAFRGLPWGVGAFVVYKTYEKFTASHDHHHDHHDPHHAHAKEVKAKTLASLNKYNIPPDFNDHFMHAYAGPTIIIDQFVAPHQLSTPASDRKSFTIPSDFRVLPKQTE